MDALSEISPVIWWLIIVGAVWSLVWKGLALWKAAKNSQRAWYIVMLIVNTAGILELIYIFAVSKKKAKPTQVS